MIRPTFGTTVKLPIDDYHEVIRQGLIACGIAASVGAVTGTQNRGDHIVVTCDDFEMKVVQ